ncbi:P-loop NTPase fold protein [Mesorhizobium sp. UC22_110]|uniref:KAP family P-loop NTPase fold protein n=1 Tax=unclassified Mesorhizobium TaxID=325217 RepID=UPI00366A8CAE
MTEDIWAGDHLNRKEDAQFLTAYLLQRNELALAPGEKGTSINVSAQWGAGKTFFLTRLAKQLRQDSYRVAEVNAWRDDHADDPIFAVMSAVLKALGKKTKTAKVGKALIDSAGKIAIRALKGGVKRAAAVVIAKDEIDGIGDDIAKALTEAGEETIGEFADKALKHFEDGQKAIDEFRTELAAAVKGEKPLFVLVDELDRCRPTYAVSLLERIKHLFDVPNVIFVFGTNSDQLTHTIKSVYGIGFDAERYLHRFFDRTYQFDAPSTRAFIGAKCEALSLKQERFLGISKPDQWDCLEYISERKNLSLRDIDQCLEVLWSVSEQLDKRVPIPLLYLYPLIVAFHLRKIGIFDAASSSTSPNPASPEELSTFFDRTPFFDHPNYRSPSFGQHTVAGSLYEVCGNFRSIIQNGLNIDLAETSGGAEYAERYRQGEQSIRSDRHAQRFLGSMLQEYGSMIRRAGRITTTVNPNQRT